MAGGNHPDHFLALEPKSGKEAKNISKHAEKSIDCFKLKHCPQKAEYKFVIGRSNNNLAGVYFEQPVCDDIFLTGEISYFGSESRVRILIGYP